MSHTLRKLKTLSLLCGVLIVVQSRINGELSLLMGDSLEAALVSFGTGLTFVILISLVRADIRAGYQDILKASKLKQLPSWRLGAGVLGASFVVVSTHVVPIAGVVLFTVSTLAGQTVISLWVDHIGVAGGVKTVITRRRVIAAFITVSAVIVSAWDRFAMSDFSVLAITLAV